MAVIRGNRLFQRCLQMVITDLEWLYVIQKIPKVGTESTPATIMGKAVKLCGGYPRHVCTAYKDGT